MEYVVGFMFDERDDNVLLIQKTKPAWQLGKLNGVGGKIEPGETPLDAMAREFKEETGIEHDWIYWTHVITLEGPDYKVYFFRTEGNPYLAKAITEEKPIVVDWRDLPPSTIYNLRWMLPLVKDTSVRFPIVVQDRLKDTDSTGVA